MSAANPAQATNGGAQTGPDSSWLLEFRNIRIVYDNWSEGVRRARAESADAVLVSQVVTQRDAHLINTREMSTAFRTAMGSRRPVLVVGGPRFDPNAADELGVDQVFGRGTTPGEVASYLVHALAQRAGVTAEVPATASA